MTGKPSTNVFLEENDGALAVHHTLDLPRIPSLELPLSVMNNPSSVARAIGMCGGIENIWDAFQESDDVSAQKGLGLFMNAKFSDHSMRGESSNTWNEESTVRIEMEGKGLEKHNAEDFNFNPLPFFNEHPIIGKRVPNRDESIVLKITMPKGTLALNNGEISTALASLDISQYNVIPVAVIDNSIRFREISDFQVRLDNVPLATDFQSSFGQMDWKSLSKLVESVPEFDNRPQENINKLVVNRQMKTYNDDFQLPPPPRFSTVGYPLPYRYKSNPLAKKKSDGNREVQGTYLKNYQLLVHDFNDDTNIPSEPHNLLLQDYETAKRDKVYPKTKKVSRFYENLEECLALLKTLFDRRPIWVKRHLDGIIPVKLQQCSKIALALLSYRFTMGPWRNTYIKLGVDPRSSNQYAKYQTEYFKIERKLLSKSQIRKRIPSPPPLQYESNRPGDIDSRFIFDGTQVPWYLMLQIDLLVTEPNIAEVYSNVQYLDKPNELTGWFTELDLGKIRRIVKYELGCMVQGNFDFNVYKLKYFKNMLYTKESMMLQSTENSSITKQIEDDDDDNGIQTGQPEEADLEAEDQDAEEDTRLEVADADEFDITQATFSDIINRISDYDPAAAQYMKSHLDGIVYENNI